MWKENVNGNVKYVYLANSSGFKGKSDRDKYEKARKLKKYIDTIRKDYRKNLKAKYVVVFELWVWEYDAVTQNTTHFTLDRKQKPSESTEGHCYVDH